MNRLARAIAAALLLASCEPVYAAPPVTVIVSPDQVNVTLQTDGDQVTIDDGSTRVTVTAPADDLLTVSTGEQGPPGPAGHTPVLTWSGDQIAVDGSATGPHLTGPQGASGPNLVNASTATPLSGYLTGNGSFVTTTTGPQACIDYYDGAQGPAGPAGPPNSLAIGTVTTLAPGSSATATVSGTPPSQTLNLGLPQGAQGDPGTLTRQNITDKLLIASDIAVNLQPASNSTTVAALVVKDYAGNAAVILRNGSIEMQDSSGVLVAKIDRATRTFTMYYATGTVGFTWSPTGGAVFQ